MKKDNIIFWVATGIISVMMLFSAFNYVSNDVVKSGFIHLGFPSYFRIELAIAKTFGAIILLFPVFPSLLREISYIGFAITFVSAFVAHLSSGDPVSVALMPLIFLVILSISYIYLHKLKPLTV